MNKKVLLAMSGGVDSSVAAAYLVEAGYEVTGVFMCLGTARADAEGGCCSPQDAADARVVAQKLGIDLHVLNLAEHFSPIIDYFVAEYQAGRTPNPCVHCNTKLKFGKLVDLADTLGIDYVATGHYARIGDYQGKPALRRGADFKKDQSYALFGIASKNINRIMLPIGERIDKAAVRDKALEVGLDVHNKPDSQEICFVEDDDYVNLLRHRAPRALKHGRIINMQGEQLGEHEGYGQFTIGQRRGLQVAAGVPMYVTKIDAETGDVTIGTREEACSKILYASGLNWHHKPTETKFDATVQIRYNHRGAPATVTLLDEDNFKVEFAEPIHAITPGQAAVIYDGEFMIGGGWIESSEQ